MKNHGFTYSVVIRTIGTGGNSYEQLLNSIEQQTIQPEEIIVVIPKGYKLQHTLGYEKIIYSEKGMCIQRAVGINAATSDYILVVDDDLKFESDLIERLYSYLLQNQLDCVLPMEGISDGQPTLDFRKSRLVKIRGAITGQYFESNKKSEYLDVLTTTAGHKVYLKSCEVDKLYYCQTACFQCFFIKTSVAQSAKFEQEIWLQEGTINQYTAYDEPVFFYKLFSRGLKMAYALQVRYQHLDARCGHIAKHQLEEKINRYYSMARNRTIYWYKFLWKDSKTTKRKVQVLLGGMYFLINYTFYNIVINIKPKSWPALRAMFIGYKDAYTTIKKIDCN